MILVDEQAHGVCKRPSPPFKREIVAQVRDEAQGLTAFDSTVIASWMLPYKLDLSLEIDLRGSNNYHLVVLKVAVDNPMRWMERRRLQEERLSTTARLTYR